MHIYSDSKGLYVAVAHQLVSLNDLSSCTGRCSLTHSESLIPVRWSRSDEMKVTLFGSLDNPQVSRAPTSIEVNVKYKFLTRFLCAYYLPNASTLSFTTCIAPDQVLNQTTIRIYNYTIPQLDHSIKSICLNVFTLRATEQEVPFQCSLKGLAIDVCMELGFRTRILIHLASASPRPTITIGEAVWRPRCCYIRSRRRGAPPNQH